MGAKGDKRALGALLGGREKCIALFGVCSWKQISKKASRILYRNERLFVLEALFDRVLHFIKPVGR